MSSMPEWFSEVFGSLLAEARSELIDRGWFQRNPMGAARGDRPDHSLSEEAGWSVPGQDHDRGIDR